MFNIFWFLIWCSFQCIRFCLTGLLLSQQTLRFGGLRAEISRYQTFSGDGLVFEFPVVHGSTCGPIEHNQHAAYVTCTLSCEFDHTRTVLYPVHSDESADYAIGKGL